MTEPASYKSLKALRKGLGKNTHTIPPPPANHSSNAPAGGYGGNGSGSGRDSGYGGYGSNDSYGAPSVPRSNPGYTGYSSNDSSFSSPGPSGFGTPAPAQRLGAPSGGAIGGASAPAKKGWSGSVENKMRAASETHTDYASEMGHGAPGAIPTRPPLGQPSYGAQADPMSRESSSMSGPGPSAVNAKPSRWGFGRTNSGMTTDSRNSQYSEAPSEQPSGSRWGFGNKDKDRLNADPNANPNSNASSRSNSYRRQAPGQAPGNQDTKRGWSGRANPNGGINGTVRDSETGRYVPPSARTGGGAAAQASYATRDPVTGRYIPPSERQPVEGGGEQQQSWAEWATSGATSAWTATSSTATNAWTSTQKTASDSWDTVNAADKRDKALGAVGTGAAKVAGGAVKLMGKGIWAVGKAATR